MSVTPSSTIVGAFRDRALAERAVDALNGAGFGNDQIQLSTPGSSGGLFEGLKSFFSGTSTSDGNNLANDLANMGLSDAEVQHYTTEYGNGSTLLVVRAPGRESEATQLMWQYGAYNAGAPENTPATQQPVESNAQSSFTPSGEYNIAQDWATQPQVSTAETHPSAASQPDYVTHEPDISSQSTSPVTSVEGTDLQSLPPPVSADSAEVHDTQASVTSVDGETASQGAQSPVTSVDGETAPQDVQSPVAAPEHDLESPTSQPDVTSPSDSEEQHAAEQVTDMADQHATNDQDIQAPHQAYEPASLNGTANEAAPETSTAAPAAQAEVSTPVLEADTPAMAAAVGDDASSQTAAVSAEHGAEPQAAQTTSVTSDQEAEAPTSQTPVVTAEQGDEVQPAQASVDTSTNTPNAPVLQDTDVQATPVSADTPEAVAVAPATQEYEVQPVAAPADTLNSDADTPVVQDTGVQPAPADVASVGTTTTSAIQDTGTQPAPEQMDELEQLQAQIQTLRQQIEEAKTQLQAAKERESQLKAAKREQQLQTVRQQIQQLQAELQATQAELQETHTRITQYQ